MLVFINHIACTRRGVKVGHRAPTESDTQHASTEKTESLGSLRVKSPWKLPRALLNHQRNPNSPGGAWDKLRRNDVGHREFCVYSRQSISVRILYIVVPLKRHNHNKRSEGVSWNIVSLITELIDRLASRWCALVEIISLVDSRCRSDNKIRKNERVGRKIRKLRSIKKEKGMEEIGGSFTTENNYEHHPSQLLYKPCVSFQFSFQLRLLFPATCPHQKPSTVYLTVINCID